MNAAVKSSSGSIVPLLSVITFIGFLDTHLLIPIMSLYVSDFGIGTALVGVIVGMYSIINTPANLWFGRVVDRSGFKRPLVFGLIGDAASMFLYPVCRLPLHFFLTRALHGLSGGMFGPATMSLMSYQGQRGRQGNTMAFYGMALAAASLVGYPLSGILSSRFGYNTVFFLGGGLLVLAIGLALWLAVRVPSHEPVLPGSGAVSWRQWGILLRRRALIGPYITVFAQYFPLGGVMTLLPLYARGFGLESMHVGIILAAFPCLFLLLQVPVGRLSDRLGRRRLVMAGLIIGTAAVLALPFCHSFVTMFLAMAVYGVAFGFNFPGIMAGVVDAAAPEERGAATGIFHALLTAGVAVGAPIIGWIGELAGFEVGLGSLTAVFVLALVVVAVTGPRR